MTSTGAYPESTAAYLESTGRFETLGSRDSRFICHTKDFEKRVFVPVFLKSGINNISFETLKR